MSVMRDQCPAALPMADVLGKGPGIVCRVIAQDREREDGIGLTAGGTGAAREAPDGVVHAASDDYETVAYLCCGQGLPVVHEDQRSPNYTCCPKWQAERERLWAGRDELAGEDARPEPFATDDQGEYLDPMTEFEFGGEDPNVALDPDAGFALLQE